MEYQGTQLTIPTPQPITEGGSKLIALDLFSGCGGSSEGLRQAGYKLVGAVEIDKVNAQAHHLNFPGCKMINADISTLTAADIREQTGIKDTEIDLTVSSPPCQSFSHAGKRDLLDPRAKLLMDSCKLIVELNPKYFWIENVKGLLQGKQRIFFEDAIEYLQQHYKVEHHLFNAKDFGVPQSRERVFIIGCRQEFTLPNSFPTTTTPTVKDAIADLPNIEDYPELLEQHFVKAEYKKSSEYADKLRSHSDFLSYSWRTKHTDKVIDRFSKVAPGSKDSVSWAYRLSWDGISNTLRAGKGNYTALRPIHPDKHRLITIREMARLQSIPDWFFLSENILHSGRQIGNSVPPLMSRAIASTFIAFSR